MARQFQRELTPAKPVTSVANPLGIKTKAEQPTRISFGQDFVFEHCMPVHQVVSGEPANPFRDLQNSPQSYGFPC